MIEPESYVVVQKLSGEHKRVMKFSRSAKQSVLIEKLRFSVEGAFGHPFGLFDVRDGNLFPVNSKACIDSSEIAGVESKSNLNGLTETASEVSASNSNNEEQEPKSKRQKLSQTEIEELKESGIGTDDLVSRLVEGNQSFAERTSFAQDKYIRRKTRKHADRVLLLKPTVRDVAQSYYEKDPDRIAFLRIDQLSMMLTFSGVRTGARVVVLDQCQGLVTAALLERLGGRGMCIHLHKGQQAQAIPCIHSMQFDEKTMLACYFLPLLSILSEEDQKTPEEVTSECRHNIDKYEGADKRTGEKLDSEKKLERQKRQDQRHVLALAELKNAKMDALLLAVKTVDAREALSKCFQFLAPSSPFVVFSPFMKSLIECYEWAKDNGCLNLQLLDSFYRRYQLLPERTHPEMQQTIAGGFILTGIKVIS